MTDRIKYLIYTCLFVLLASGLLYAIPRYLDRWFFYAVDWLPSAYWPMALHGAAAFVMLFLFGHIWQIHVRKNLKRDQRRASGLLALCAVSALVLTGYALYYLGGEEWRRFAGDSHVLLGVLLSFALVSHRSAHSDTQ